MDVTGKEAVDDADVNRQEETKSYADQSRRDCHSAVQAGEPQLCQHEWHGKQCGYENHSGDCAETEQQEVSDGPPSIMDCRHHQQRNGR